MTLVDFAKLVKRWRYLLQKMPKVDRLHLACGNNLLPGWINTDYFPGQGIYRLNAAKALPFASGSLRYVFSEHFIEHISYEQGVKLLREANRVLAAGGRIRIATPDFEFLWRQYKSPNSEYVTWAAEHCSIPSTVLHMINNAVRNWGHQFIWDFPAMKAALESVGFVDVRRYEPGQSDDPVLRGIEGHGQIVPEKWNQLETFVAEATKPMSNVEAAEGRSSK